MESQGSVASLATDSYVSSVMMLKRILIAGTLVLAWSSCDEIDDPSPFVEETYKHIRAAWSPDGLTIAFTASIGNVQGIYAVDSSGSNVRLVKLGEGIGLTWSPDSRWIGFSAAGSLYKVLATGDSPTRLTTNATHLRPAWSPDGSLIAFRSGGLKTLNVQSDTIIDVLTYGDFPSWHPNGTQIVFLNSTSAGGGRWSYGFEAITVGTNQISIYFSFYSSTDCGFSSISPTGQEIVFSSKPLNASGYTQVVRLNINQSSLVQLTLDGGDYPAWNHDGSQIVYTRTTKGDGGLWIMNKDGSGKRRLTQP